MKSVTEYLTLSLPERMAFENITPKIEEIVRRSEIREGLLLCNADAHMKRQIMGREVVVAVTDGKLDFGPWEQVFYGEFDGRRPKRVLVKIIGE